ncbi:KTSC domain-containing protein [Synergistales bacterium]|nr:KTSC domain-containing protein [Synergistales bacterium]
MQRTPVQSNNLKSVGYDPALKLLEIEFLSDHSVWQYHGVPPELYARLMAAHSRGSFFSRNIRAHPERYDPHRIR